jgi:hypothetical protein
MYSIKPKTYFFKSFKNSTAFSLSNIVILFNFTPKTTLITRKISIFANHLKKRRPPSFQTKIHGKDNLFYFGTVIKNNERKNRNNDYFKSIHSKLLLLIPGKSDFFSYQRVNRRRDKRKILNKHFIINCHFNKNSCLGNIIRKKPFYNLYYFKRVKISS